MQANNHVKAGKQPVVWKQAIKSHLDALANEPNFLPEIARRLGDPAYTQHLNLTREGLVQFFRDPKEHLFQTIRELSKIHRAALTLVFLHRGNMPVGAISPGMKDLVLKHFGVDVESLGNAIAELRDSFLVQRADGLQNVTTFKHPTIGDALSAILGETDGMKELYLRGVKAQTILTEVVCAGGPESEYAVVIDAPLEDLLVERLAEIPDEQSINRLFFSFLHERASDTAFRKIIERYPTALARKAYASRFMAYDPKMLAHGRALSVGLLSKELRFETGERLESGLLEQPEANVLDSDKMLALIRPTKLLTLLRRMRDEFLTQV